MTGGRQEIKPRRQRDGGNDGHARDVTRRESAL